MRPDLLSHRASRAPARDEFTSQEPLVRLQRNWALPELDKQGRRATLTSADFVLSTDPSDLYCVATI
ncbi:hypothetical protein ACFXO9_14960 [Nocardia tengchongensis]|uniref:hypothetical protein n=1 Tax=Nocardia tengchongensis TaxID=2055889 RepID=UPI0036A7E8A4